MDAIGAALDSVTVGEPVISGRLTMVPLLGRASAAVAYATLDEALGSGAFRITEKGEGGSVPELLVLNDLDRPVLLLDGEELVGAKQNRIINVTVLVPGKRRVQLPVSCVEAGRWHHRTRHFASAPRAYYATGRAMKARDVSDAYRATGRPMSDQGAIWNDIALKSALFEARSDTSAMDAMYERSAVELEELETRFQPMPNQVGAVFMIGGRPIGLDLFESPDVWKKLSPKLIASYGLDSLDRRLAEAPQARDRGQETAAARSLLAGVVELQQERYASAGLGEDVRLSGPTLAGGALVVDERLVHLAVFAS